MPRNPEISPRIYFTPHETTTPIKGIPQVPVESSEETARKAAYEERLAKVESEVANKFADRPDLERLARQAKIVLEDTLNLEFTKLHPEKTLIARREVWDAFLEEEKGREEALIQQREELGRRSLWIAVKGEVEERLKIKRPEPPRKKARNLWS